MPRNNTARKLDNHLTLHGWLNSHFKYKATQDLLNAVKNEEEGFNPDGHSPICEFLISRTDPELRTYHLMKSTDNKSTNVIL